MATPVTLLQLSPTMSEGTIVRWLVKEGDSISAGDILAEIETDKAVMEQEAFEDGTVLKLSVKEGDKASVGDEIALVGEAGEDVSSASSGGAAAKKEEKKEAAPEDKPAAKAQPAQAVAKAPAPPKEEKSAPAAASNGSVMASPLARKMASDNDLDLKQIEGSGPRGRVVKRDIEKALQSGTGKASPAAAPGGYGAAEGKDVASPVKSKPVAVESASGDEELAVSGMRSVIAKRLVQSRQQVPSFSLTVEVDAANVLAAVKKVRDLTDEKVTVTHFIIKAMANTLRRHPWLRTQWDEANNTMVRKDAVHISCAVALPEGLVTPVIRDADRKGVVQISQDLKELAGKARDKGLKPAEMSGGVQTISNLGMFGIDHFDAIINPPETSILAVGAVLEKPVVRNGGLDVGKVFNMTLSSDHRVVDGAVAAAYLKDLKAALDDPFLMLV
ncbi:MAG: dihydrolipoamide acetyltransferase family protein [Sumerlaeia bacterium]